MNEAVIMAKLAIIEGKLDMLLASGGSGAPARPAADGRRQASTEGAIAPDSDLDDPRGHGDPVIKFDPRKKYWTGASCVGRKFSQVLEPEYLDAMAKYLDACAYMAEQDGDEKKRSGARFKKLDAGRARGWAKRLRERGVTGAPAQASNGAAASDWGDGGGGYGGGGDDQIPF